MKVQLPLWEERWSEIALRKRLGEIGQRAFDRGFRQLALSDSEKTFQAFDTCVVLGEDPLNYIESGDPTFVGVDPSGEGRPGSCIFTLARKQDGVRVPLMIEYTASKPEELAQRIVEVNNTFRPQAIYFENNALQEAYISLTKLLGGKDIPIRGFHTGKQKSDPAIGLPSLEIEFENKAWIICEPSHEIGCQCSWHRWFREMRNYPLYLTSDGVMAAWFAREACKLQTGNLKLVQAAIQRSRWSPTNNKPSEVPMAPQPVELHRYGGSRWKRR